MTARWAAIASMRAVLGMATMKHEARADRKFRNAIRRASLHMTGTPPPALFVTDPDRTPHILSTAEHLPDGVGILFRHFGRDDQIALAPQLAALCRSQGRVLLVSGDNILARTLGASGVHWPARMAGEVRAPALEGKRGIRTMSVHSAKELRLARHLGMDAVLVSTILSSDSPSADNPIGLARLAAYVRQSRMSVYALGGITSKNAERVAVLAGFASVSGFSDVYGPRI